MTSTPQPGWTRVHTATGRYEYQFQGRAPSVRNARYEDAADYSFLVMDEGGWLYKIPVRFAAPAEKALAQDPGGAGEGSAQPPGAIRVAEAQLRAGLEKFRPRPNAPYAELDRYFAVDVARARELAGGKP